MRDRRLCLPRSATVAVQPALDAVDAMLALPSSTLFRGPTLTLPMLMAELPHIAAALVLQVDAHPEADVTLPIVLELLFRRHRLEVLQHTLRRPDVASANFVGEAKLSLVDVGTALRGTSVRLAASRSVGSSGGGRACRPC